MTTRVWLGQSPAVAQRSQAQCTGTIGNPDTYQCVVNGEVINSFVSSGSTTCLILVQALASGFNAATGKAYARGITATGYTTGGLIYLDFVSDIPGNPHAVSVNATGASPTFPAFADTIANVSPNDWANAVNWSGGVVPIAADDVVFRDSTVPVLWGLDQAAVTLASLVIEQTYTGTIGLNQRQYVTGANGAADTSRPEWRDDYLDIGWDECRIGEIVGPGNPGGSGRLKLDNAKAGASTTTIFNSSAGGADSNLPNVRLLLAHASADVLVREASGGVGIAMDDPAETSTCGDISVSDETTASRVFIGEGVTLNSFSQQGGDNVLRSAATVTGVTVLGGQLTIEGSNYNITQLDVEGGTVYPNSTTTSGVAVTTINIDGGTVDGSQSREPRTWGTCNLGKPGSALIADSDAVDIATLNEPSGPYSLGLV